MVFKFLSNLWITNDANEFDSLIQDNMIKLKIDNQNPMNNIKMTSHAFLNLKTILVFYDDTPSLINYLKEFVIIQGGGQSYVNELESIIKMNLGLT